ncbi:MAG: hypothetical protein RQ722_01825 [Desulfuromonadales bacterium]|nr:hypothetical protein [Desulfuromonadales bacterium]
MAGMLYVTDTKGGFPLARFSTFSFSLLYQPLALAAGMDNLRHACCSYTYASTIGRVRPQSGFHLSSKLIPEGGQQQGESEGRFHEMKGKVKEFAGKAQLKAGEVTKVFND